MKDFTILAFTVENIQDRINELKASGLRMIDESPAHRRPSHADRIRSSQEHVWGSDGIV